MQQESCRRGQRAVQISCERFLYERYFESRDQCKRTSSDTFGEGHSVNKSSIGPFRAHVSPTVSATKVGNKFSLNKV